MLGKAGPALDDVLVLRVLASSLGIGQISGQVAYLLPRNATIPTKREASDGHCAPMQPVNCKFVDPVTVLCSAISTHAWSCPYSITRRISRPPIP